MEFPFDVNQLFSERISVLDQNLVGGRRSAGRPDLQDRITTVIDELGRASAKAQQLSTPITSASRLQTQKHQLYLLKDAESCSGRGLMVGYLKVGYKKLFLLDRHGVHVEAEPLSVLDFYVSEKLQRHGYGLELFSFMLKHKDVEPVTMAYDRPSPKFLSFLAKHYCLSDSVPQVNNFVVFEGFFINRTGKTNNQKAKPKTKSKRAAQLRKAPLKKPDGEIKPYSLMEREVVRQEQRTLPWPFAPPQSPRRSVSSQCSQSLSVGSSPSRAVPPVASSRFPGGSWDQSPQSPLIERCRAKRSSSHLGLAARSSLYSRHMDGSAAQLLTRLLPGVNPLAFTDTHRLATSLTAQSSRNLPPSQREDSQTAVMSGTMAPATTATTTTTSSPAAEPVQETDAHRHPAGGWSWLVGDVGSASHSRKQMQEHRSTRPW